eukprot:TRINITY_DN1387_c0_g1_i1.p1 TRINITY_DN1387_c0_g1~~TRINITY_DN1387_c0_g1_i1.p1  ORF type:complete len:245 (+),score=59.05 TRINITY_DN1387_c0_g1_i1:47-781(+)
MARDSPLVLGYRVTLIAAHKCMRSGQVVVCEAGSQGRVCGSEGGKPVVRMDGDVDAPALIFKVDLEDVIGHGMLEPKTKVVSDALLLTKRDRTRMIAAGSVGDVVRFDTALNRYVVQFPTLQAHVPPDLLQPVREAAPVAPCPPIEKAPSFRRRQHSRPDEDNLSFTSEASSGFSELSEDGDQSDPAMMNITKRPSVSILCGTLRPQRKPSVRSVTFEVAEWGAEPVRTYRKQSMRRRSRSESL